MKKIAIMSLKGGTGKSTCTAQIGLALQRQRYYIGFLDLDIHGPNLPLSLGLGEPPELEGDTESEVVLPTRINGYELISMSSLFGEGTRILWEGKKKLDLARQLLTGVIGWGELDFLLIDTPPSQGEEVMGLFDYLPDMYGVLIICQPTDFAKADTERVIDLLRVKKIPIIGIVANMDGAICPECGTRFYPFLTKRSDLSEFASKNKIPLIASLPQVSDIELLKALFDDIGKKVVSLKPTKLPSYESRKKFKGESLKIVLGERDE